MSSRVPPSIDTLRSEVLPVAHAEAEACDRDAVWPERSMAALRDAGFLGLVIPKEHGGLGGGLEMLLESTRALGYASGSVGLCFGMHCVGAAVLAAKPTPEQVERFIRPIAANEHLTTLALSEPGTGSHFYLPEMTVEESDAGLRLVGTKSFATNGGHADSYVMSARSIDEAAAPGEFSCMIVPGDTKGLAWREPWAGMGMRGNSSRTVDVDVYLPKEHLLGATGDQIWYAFHVVAPYFLAAMTGVYLGIADRAVEEAGKHLKGRTYSDTGTSLAMNPILQNRYGRVWTRLRATYDLASSAMHRADAGDETAFPAVMAAKALVGEAVIDVTNTCSELMGGRGYGRNDVMDRLIRDAHAANVMSPTTEMLYTWTGRHGLDVPMLLE